ncbi:hypothetical protein BDW27_104161 [Nocardiopsis sp. L17-MgMaSL7]|nr:hypothetical protein BDW27_104161 [Nocardiopsis sp. L17-MgMaSL7]
MSTNSLCLNAFDTPPERQGDVSRVVRSRTADSPPLLFEKAGEPVGGPAPDLRGSLMRLILKGTRVKRVPFCLDSLTGSVMDKLSFAFRIPAQAETGVPCEITLDELSVRHQANPRG